MLTIWNEFLYKPLFNLLIWIYNNWTAGDLGWAVVYLTIILRVALLPFFLINEFNRLKNEELYKEIKDIDKVYQNDQVLKKQEIRRVLKQRRVQPWAKVVVLGIQALVLVLLYQVFLRGITGEKILKILYNSVEFPGVINTYFYGFDLGMRHDFIWAGAVGVFLLVEIYLKFRRLKGGVQKRDLAYFIFFPLAVFIMLWLLPMVKSLFILTSFIFSVVAGKIAKLFFHGKTKNKLAETPNQ